MIRREGTSVQASSLTHPFTTKLRLSGAGRRPRSTRAYYGVWHIQASWLSTVCRILAIHGHHRLATRDAAHRGRSDPPLTDASTALPRGQNADSGRRTSAIPSTLLFCSCYLPWLLTKPTGTIVFKVQPFAQHITMAGRGRQFRPDTLGAPGQPRAPQTYATSDAASTPDEPKSLQRLQEDTVSLSPVPFNVKHLLTPPGPQSSQHWMLLLT